MTNSKKITNLIIASSLTLAFLGAEGCNRKPPTAPKTSASPGAPGDPTAPSEPLPFEPTPGDDNNDGQAELPQEPTDVPEPIPAPTNPVSPGQPIAIKAISKTTAYALPIGGIKGNYVNIELTWQPVNGAKEYWIYKGTLPPKAQANKGTAYKVVQANGLVSTLFMDGLMPPSFAGGSIWDKIKKGIGAVTLKPGVEYTYKVFAADLDGNVIGESDAAVTIPLPPIAAPANLQVSDTASPKPLFQWSASDGAQPDGFYVSVFPPIDFGKQSFKPSNSTIGLAYWSTFRDQNVKVARYGDQSDNAVAYPGTVPFDINFPLKVGGRYSVSVTAVKTDTKDMRTAKSISKAWSESKIFMIGNPQPAAAPVATPSPSSSSGGLWDKIKGIFS